MVPLKNERILRLAEEHNSDFSKVAITNQIASVAAALIPALVLVDAEEGSGGEVNKDNMVTEL